MTNKTVVVPRKGNHKPYLCEVCYKTPVNLDSFHAMLAKELDIQEKKETLCEISRREKQVTDNWLSYWMNSYLNGK
jgi:hypothetical protein